MAIPINEVKSGLSVELDGELFRCLEFNQRRAGQQTTIKVKFKNMRTGAIINRSFSPNAKVDVAHIDFKKLQYLYTDDNFVHFMDQTSFEQLALPKAKIGDDAKYLKEGFLVDISFYNDEALDVSLPSSVELTVTETAPQFRGDTVSGSKPATLETGAVVQVPFHISVGDLIKVNTAEDKYIGRV
ncbi:MAG: elongation factor P [bacterium]